MKLVLVSFHNGLQKTAETNEIEDETSFSFAKSIVL